MEELAALLPLNQFTPTSGADTDPLTGFIGVTPVSLSSSSSPLPGGTSPADRDTPNILEVTGTGEVTVPTTLAQVQLGVQVQEETASDVTEELAQLSTAVVDVLQDFGVEDLQTTSIQLNPVFSFEDGTQRLTGFEGRNILEFELPTEQAGAAIDAAIAVGANIVQSINFIAEETALQQARLDALSESVTDAQTEANAVLNSLGLFPGEIVNIDIDAADTINPPPLLFGARAEALDATTPILGGPQTVQASVSLDIVYFPADSSTLDTATVF
jgi:hypothetical protein